MCPRSISINSRRESDDDEDPLVVVVVLQRSCEMMKAMEAVNLHQPLKALEDR